MAILSPERIDRFLRGEYESPEMQAAVSWAEGELGISPTEENARILRGIAAVKAGANSEAVAKVLSWKEFESFCAALLRARGLSVRENLMLTKPRAQVDLLARSGSLALLIDCKHWAKTMGSSALSQVALAQARRAGLVRRKIRDVEPMVVVILVLSNEVTRYVEGAAVVPIYALADFIDNLGAYSEGLERY
jgi:hypothetical protein